MSTRLLIATVALGFLTATAFGDMNAARGNWNGGGNWHGGGYLPWHGSGFGLVYPYDYPSGPSTASQPSTPPYDLASADFQNRWADLQVILSRARDDFQISSDYLAARHDYESAEANYEAAVDAVLSRVHADPKYKDLAEKRTEEQVAMKSTGIGTGTRNVIAAETMHYGSLATLMEAQALANDATVADARDRLVSTHEVLSLKEKMFESQLYHQPDVAAAREQMESARASKAGAEGYLNGAIITWMGY
jgi:hypothetical protein